MKLTNSKFYIVFIICLLIVVVWCVAYNHRAKVPVENMRLNTNEGINSIPLNNNVNEKSSENLISLITKQPVYIFEGIVTQKVSKNTDLESEQYEINVSDSLRGNLKGKKVIVNVPAGTELKDKSRSSFVAIYDSKNNWYDTKDFQGLYRFFGTVLSQVGDKSILNTNLIQYEVKYTNYGSTSPLEGKMVKVDVLSTDIALTNRREYYFYALRDPISGEFIIIDVRPTLPTGDQ